jgi:tetratricopeptide (TPR) repeat protein
LRRYRLLPPLLLAIGCASQPEGVVYHTNRDWTGLESGIGAENCNLLNQSDEFFDSNRLSDAEAIIDEVIERFDAIMSDPGATYVSMANHIDFDTFRENNPELEQAVWIDWCYREALSRKAYILAERDDLPRALRYLELELKAAPYAAPPYAEAGYIFNRQGRYKEAASSFRKALEITDQFPSAHLSRPIALRGLGFALIEMGDLDAAESAFRESLEFEPDNELALNELKYIQHHRALAE